MKSKNWQLYTIVFVCIVSLYNVFPTFWYYSKPIHNPINEKNYKDLIATPIVERLKTMEGNTYKWLQSFNELIGIKAKKIKFLTDRPGLIQLTFESKKDLNKFETLLPPAGKLIPFEPARLSLYSMNLPNQPEEELYAAYVMHQMPVRINVENEVEYFDFHKMYRKDGTISQNYQTLLFDRLLQIVHETSGTTENAAIVSFVTSHNFDYSNRVYDLVNTLAERIVHVEKNFRNSPQLKKAFLSSFFMGNFDKDKTLTDLLDLFVIYKDKIRAKRITEKDPIKTNLLQIKEDKLLQSISLLKNRSTLFTSGEIPLQDEDIYTIFEKINLPNTTKYYVPLHKYNPIIEAVELDTEEERIVFYINKDLLKFKNNTNSKNLQTDINRLIYKEIARISDNTNENFVPMEQNFIINTKLNPDSSGFVCLDLEHLARTKVHFIKTTLTKEWHPKSIDLQRSIYPIVDWITFKNNPPAKQHFQMVVFTPLMIAGDTPMGMKDNSLYIIAKDWKTISQKFSADSKELQNFQEDFQSLSRLLEKNGFIGYPGSHINLSKNFENDYIFEISDYYYPYIQATYEDFKVYGTKRKAILETSDFGNRIKILNNIDTKIHENLLQWNDLYNSAQVSLYPKKILEVPKPTKNVYLENFLLSVKKYFRGNPDKVLHWGLDLSGGKTIKLGIKDLNNQPITNSDYIAKSVEEIRNRINKLGLSDIHIRSEGPTIVVDIPGGTKVSSDTLINSSLMTFNIVNEKFSTDRSAFSQEVKAFLSDVWNEAVVTNKKDIQSINQIAWSHLYGVDTEGSSFELQSDNAKLLLENGLSLANPNNSQSSNIFDDTTSKIALYKPEKKLYWQGNNPLLIVFKNHALEGSSLKDVTSNYNNTKGNFISFSVPKQKDQKALQQWTAAFSKDGTSEKLQDVDNKGWRMAVILDNEVISSPILEAPIITGGTISGNFTQSEVNKLATDLKAGSLSFTPQILSEKNISAELGKHKRLMGITAAGIGLLSVVTIMIGYYRFAGFVASIAVVFNILILWAALQTLGASITLASITGIVLTIGMAVDANVLVFERIREEFAKLGNISFAIREGYKKAFSAIMDSNITTIVVAIVLLHFDSGPIRGFATTLSVGILSSIFTSLFVTKWIFYKWAKNPKNVKLKMANFIKVNNFNFLRCGNIALSITAITLLFGGLIGYKEKNNILGIDFTGGYSFHLKVAKNQNSNHIQKIEDVLNRANISSNEMEIRELNSPNNLRIFLSKNIDKKNDLFEHCKSDKNLCIHWFVNLLQQSGIELLPDSLKTMEQSWEYIGNRFSEHAKQQSFVGLLISLIFVMTYLSIRFEFQFALAAIVGILCDLMLLASFVFIGYFLGMNIKLDLNCIAATMTTIGYSLNDTIVVFDRIRENIKNNFKKHSFKEICNLSLNQTLSRTILTSVTTFVVLLSLIIFGGNVLLSFSFVMAIGVVVGTLSTLFVVPRVILLCYKEN